MIEIPHTTLCCIDCYNYELSIKAIKRCLQACHFEKTLFLTDMEYQLDHIDVQKIPSIKTKEQYSMFLVRELQNYINTDFVLIIQFDGFIVNPDSWTVEFQQYDYIGAKWDYTDGLNVGNGGFSLRSKRLLQALSNKDIVIDSLKYGEDTFICRTYRRFLEKQYNIKFAPESIADKFSHEHFEPVGKPFGFHGLFNIWRYIEPNEIENFINLISPRSITAKQAIEAIELGLNYHTSGHLREAEIIYQKILEHYPDHTDVLALLKGLTHHKSGHLREAEMVYREMLEDYPDHIYLLALLEMVRS